MSSTKERNDVDEAVNETLGIYSLGAAIIDHQALVRVLDYHNKIFGYSGRTMEDEGWFLSVVPPFRATYDMALKKSLYHISEGLLSNHYINTTTFCMRGIELVRHTEGSSLIFPIEAHRSKGIKDWEHYALEKMRTISSVGATFRGQERLPHCTQIILEENVDPARERELAGIVRESRKEPPLYFRAASLCLYAHYPHGWDVLLRDPVEA